MIQTKLMGAKQDLTYENVSTGYNPFGLLPDRQGADKLYHIDEFQRASRCQRFIWIFGG